MMDKTGYDTKLEKLGLSTIANYRKAYQNTDTRERIKIKIQIQNSEEIDIEE